MFNATETNQRSVTQTHLNMLLSFNFINYKLTFPGMDFGRKSRTELKGKSVFTCLSLCILEMKYE